MQRGFTLIELLVVILIILIISAVALPTVLPALAHRQVSEAARILQGALVGARDNAIHNNAPSGIRLIPDPLFNGINPTTGVLDPSQILACNRIIPLDPAPEYSEGAVSVYVTAGTSGSNNYASSSLTVNGYSSCTCLVIEETVNDASGAPLPPTSWFWNIRIGDKLQISNAGPWYTVVGPMTTPNPELFVNIGPPGTTLPTLLGGQPGEYLLLVNGQDDNNNGWVDEGFDNVDNNGNGTIDEQGLVVGKITYNEWEQETWIGSVGTKGVFNQQYTIQRRPAPSANAREIALPSNVVIDLTSWGSFTAGTGTNVVTIAPSPERSRVPSGAFNPVSGTVDILISPDGTVVPTTIYSSPASIGMSAAFIHLWLAERGDLLAPDTNQTSAPFLPLPQGIAPARFVGGAELKGEYRLVTLFARTGQISTNDTVPFDIGNVGTASYNTSLPYTAAQQGIRGGP